MSNPLPLLSSTHPPSATSSATNTPDCSELTTHCGHKPISSEMDTRDFSERLEVKNTDLMVLDDWVERENHAQEPRVKTRLLRELQLE